MRRITNNRLAAQSATSYLTRKRLRKLLRRERSTIGGRKAGILRFKIE